MFMDRKTQYCQDIRFFNLICGFSEIPQQVICGHGQTDSQVCMENQRTQDRWYNIEGEKLENRHYPSFKSYSNPDCL